MSWIPVAIAVLVAFAAYLAVSEWLVRRQRQRGRDDSPVAYAARPGHRRSPFDDY